MKKALLILCVLFFSCAEKLLEKPENLISKDKMVDIVEDLTLIKAAKSTNGSVLERYDIETMNYIYDKYTIDSVGLAESNKYYASLPDEYAEIYTKVEERIKAERDRLKEERKIQDSIKKAERQLKQKNRTTPATPQ